MKIWLPMAIASHVLFWIYWPLALLPLAVGVGIWIRATPRRLLPLAGLSPFVLVPAVMFAWGMASYAAGSACLMTYGEPHPLGESLDPEVRCYWRTSGCVTDGSEPFIQTPNNAGIRLMAACFGPMPGAYHGAYPSLYEARALLAREPARMTFRELGAALWASGLPETGEWARLCLRWEPKDEAWARVEVDGQAVLVANPRWAILIEKATGRVVARYLL